jgi:hypothetical protein
MIPFAARIFLTFALSAGFRPRIVPMYSPASLRAARCCWGTRPPYDAILLAKAIAARTPFSAWTFFTFAFFAAGSIRIDPMYVPCSFRALLRAGVRVILLRGVVPFEGAIPFELLAWARTASTRLNAIAS